MSADPFEIAYLAGFAAAFVLRAVHARALRGSKHRKVRRVHAARSDGVLLALAAAGMLAPFVSLFSPWLRAADYRRPAWAGWAGVGLFGATLYLLWRSHADLGKAWSAPLRIYEGQRLVTNGVYRRVRHPMYAAHGLWALAQALLIGNWIAGPAFLVAFLPFYFVRVRREERMLAEHFGEEYRAYRARTGGLIPRLWG